MYIAPKLRYFSFYDKKWNKLNVIHAKNDVSLHKILTLTQYCANLVKGHGSQIFRKVLYMILLQENHRLKIFKNFEVS